MESRVYQPYTHYDSIIADGKRIRRMRRTQLSAQKILNNSSKVKGQAIFASPRVHKSRQKKSSSRSHPKVEPKRAADKQNFYKIANAQNEYFNTTSIKGNLNINKNAEIKKHQPSILKKESELKQSKSNQSINNDNSYARIAKDIYHEGSHGPAKISTQFSLNPNQGKGLVNQQFNKQISQNMSKNSSKKIHDSQISMKNKEEQKKSAIKNQYDDYGLSNQKSKSKGSQISEKQGKRQSFEQSKISHQSKDKNQSLSKIKLNQLNVPNVLQKLPSGFAQIAQNFSKHLQAAPEQTNENFSKIKYQNMEDPIINSSSQKRQSWKEAIKSLAQLSQLQNSSNIQPNTKQNKLFDSSRKMSLRMDSMRQDNNTQTIQNFSSTNKNSWKHLPLASKEPSFRRSMDNSSQRGEPGSLKGVLQNIQIHDYLITLINDFKEQTQKFSEGEDEVDILCFLLQKKHFLQKSKMIKALKGGKNIFKLSTIQIPNQYLSSYIGNDQITKVIKDLQAGNRELFKKLQKKYLQLRQNHTKSAYLKLETPNDDFSRQIVRILQKQLQQLYKTLRNNRDDDMQQQLENRIFDIMQMIFLISQTNGRQVKKIEFFQDINDFEEYYSQNEQALTETCQYFRSLK